MYINVCKTINDKKRILIIKRQLYNLFCPIEPNSYKNPIELNIVHCEPKNKLENPTSILC